MDGEFNALEEYRILLERIDLENGEKDRMLYIQREFLIFSESVVVCQIDTLETISRVLQSIELCIEWCFHCVFWNGFFMWKATVKIWERL